MKILLFPNRYYPSHGGVEKQSALLATSFARHGHSVIVLTEQFTSGLKRREKVDGVDVQRIWSPIVIRDLFLREIQLGKKILGISREWKAPASAVDRLSLPKRAVRAVYRFFFYKMPVYWCMLSSFVHLIALGKRYEVIQAFHINLFALSAIAAGKMLHKPVVICDAVIQGMDEQNEFLFYKLMRSTIIKNGRFVALSKVIASDLESRGVSIEKIALIPNSAFVPAESSNGENFQRALFVGNVLNDPFQKGLDVLIEAWKVVMRNFPDAILNIVGAGDYTVFEDQAKRFDVLKSIRFLGEQEEVASFYRANGLFILPSRREGMSNALLEAMAHGCACIATRISGSDELIQDHYNGLLVEPNDEGALADAIVEVISRPDEARIYGSRAREFIKTNHDPERIADRYLQLYAKLIDESRVNF